MGIPKETLITSSIFLPFASVIHDTFEKLTSSIDTKIWEASQMGTMESALL